MTTRAAALAGWLLITYHGGTVAWYETKEDCELASKYTANWTTACTPDRFAVEELRSKAQ